MSVLLLSLGLAAHTGIIQSTTLFYLLAACTCLGTGLIWLINVILVVERRMDRTSLAAAVEQENDMLLDRLNTVVELDQRLKDDASAAMYRDAIEKQAAGLAPKLHPANPLQKRSVTVHLVVMLLAAALAGNFYLSKSPLKTLTENEAQQTEQEDDIPQLVIPDEPLTTPTESEEQTNGTWGEIRISEPGRDLRITIHEDVPLLIEAASDRPLASITWQTQVNDSEEVTRPLPELEDPRYAVFQPTLQPKQLDLKEWDVTRYQAIANAIDETQYGSSSYFVEIVPDTAALKELPNAGYESLEELTELIHRQQQVIRSTEKLTDTDDPDQQKTMDSLAERENALASASRSVQEQLSGRLNKETLGKFSSSIEAASVDFRNAETALQERTQTNAEQTEESALMHLVDARRELAELIKQHPAAFADSALADLENQPTISATEADPEVAKLIQKLAEEHQQFNDASRGITDLLAQQEQVQQETTTLEEGPFKAFRPSELSTSQKDILNQFKSLREQFPTAFQDLQGLSDKTTESMARAAEQLGNSPNNASDAVKQAKNNLQQLHDQIEQRRNQYEQFQTKSLQQRIAANRDSYRQIAQSAETVDESKIAEAIAETRTLLQEIPNSIVNSPTTEKGAVSSDKQNMTESNGAQNSDQGESNPGPQTDSLTTTREQINEQTDILQTTSDVNQRTDAAKNLDRSLSRISEALKKESSKRKQSLDQQQLASQLQRLQNLNQAMENARNFVQDAIKREESIQSKATENLSSKDQFQKLARDQLLLEEEMATAREQNPDGFDAVASQSEQAQKQMQQTTRALNAGQENAPMTSEQAVESLKQLEQSLTQQQEQLDSRQQAQIAKQMEQLINQLSEMEKKPDDFSSAEKQQTAGQCQSVGSMACKNPGNSGAGGATARSPSPAAANQPDTAQPKASDSQNAGTAPASKPNGQPSSDGQPSEAGQPATAGSSAPAMPPGGNPGPEQALRDATERLANSNGPQETSEAAGGLKQQMKSLADSMGIPLGAEQPWGPKGKQMAAGGDSLRPGGSESLARGLAQLESAARQGKQGNLTPQANRALRENGLADIVTGIQGQYGYNDGTQLLIQRVKQELEGPKINIDLKTVNELREQIQKSQRDFVMKSDSPKDPEATLRNDPTKFPSAYRESIQNYFQALSEDKSR